MPVTTLLLRFPRSGSFGRGDRYGSWLLGTISPARCCCWMPSLSEAPSSSARGLLVDVACLLEKGSEVRRRLVLGVWILQKSICFSSLELLPVQAGPCSPAGQREGISGAAGGKFPVRGLSESSVTCGFPRLGRSASRVAWFAAILCAPRVLSISSEAGLSLQHRLWVCCWSFGSRILK